MCNLLHQMSSAEMHYAYKLFNHLCEYTIELLVNKLISNQAEYIHHNEVNKQILNFVQLKHSTNCDLLFNEVSRMYRLFVNYLICVNKRFPNLFKYCNC
ncbi:unnamed protein product [Trichobilharzia regenti]|nr:unnamed protein product [Trichobilharzia regenti]